MNAVAFTLYQDGQYTKALYFVDLLLGRNLPAKRKETAENIREEILYSQEVINSIPDFERILQNSQSINKNWFETAFKLITAYFRKKETDKYHSLLTKAYHNLLYNEEAKKEYHFTILGALFNLNLNQGVYDLALKYALERWEYASLILDLPDRFKFECINNIVVAKLKSNKLDGIYEDLEKAEMLCRNVFGEDSETFAVVLHNRGRAFQLDGKFEDAKRLYQAAINLHSKTTGSPGPNTAKYLMETEKRLVDYELDL